jgi:hypothetical protein
MQHLWVGVLCLILIASNSVTRGNTGLFLNEAFISGFQRQLNIEDPLNVLSFVLEQLPKDVNVYPSEHYYYFGFTANGRRFVGNLRFAKDRHDGIVHFAYYDQDQPSWTRFRSLDKSSGLFMEKVGNGAYQVKVGENTVTFHLMTLDQSTPQGVLRPWETFIGRSQDESGMRFLLLYNQEEPHFLWVLDDSDGIAWQMQSMAETPQLLTIGPARFVFYKDVDRYILVGVSAWSIQANDYFDGPFDQLPDERLPKTEFADWLQTAYPLLKGQVNERGEFNEPHLRASVNPYVTYATYADVVERYQSCQSLPSRSPKFYRCLCHDWKQGEFPMPIIKTNASNLQ